MSIFKIINKPVRILDGLYSLNDLHKASGGKAKHKPSNFMRRDETKEAIEVLKQQLSNGRCSNMSIKEPVRAIKGKQADGTPQGTWVCKELVYSYATWVSAAFHIAVIQTFDTVINKQYSFTQQLFELQQQHDHVNNNLSHAGWYLNKFGKEVKPKIQEAIDIITEKMQPSLDLGGN